MRILSNEPLGKDLFEGKSQERIANLIFSDLQKARNTGEGQEQISRSSVIGLEGEWGCGKSNVLKMLESKLEDVRQQGNKKKVYSLFAYDLWGRQQDLQRKVILQDLAVHLKEKCHINKDDRVRDLILKKTEVGHELVKKGFWSRIVPIVLGALVPTLLAIATIAKEGSEWRTWIVVSVLAIGVFSGIWGLVAVWKHGQNALVALSEFLGNMLLVKTNGAELPRVIYEHQYSVTVSDFSNVLAEIADELLTRQQHLVIVFDNIDRLPVEKVKEFLSSAHILFAERKEQMLANIHIIIPFDRNRILAAFDGQDGNDYINKTFDVVYRVAPPILKDWGKFFAEKYQEAVQDEPELLGQRFEVQDVFNNLSSSRRITPRSIIAFLNSVATTHNVLGNSVPLKAIALHELAWKPYEQKISQENSEESKVASDERKVAATELAETRIRNGHFIPNALLSANYLEDENWKKWMAAIVFQVDIERAGEILNYNLLKDALEEGKSDVVAELSNLPSFQLLFSRILPAVSHPEKIPAAIHGVAKEHRLWSWDKVNDVRGKDIARISSSPLGFDGWHADMLKNVSDWKKYVRALMRLDDPIEDRGEVDQQFRIACDIDNALKEVGRTLVGAFQDEEVEPSRYLELLKVAEDHVSVIGWKCDVESFDTYVAKLDISAGAAYGVEWVPTLMASKMPKTKQAFEGMQTVVVRNPIMSQAMLVNSVLASLERLGKGRIKTALQDEYKRDFVNSIHMSETENCRAYAVAMGMGMVVPENSDLYKFVSNPDAVKYAQSLAGLFERYVDVEVLLEKLSSNSKFEIYVEAVKTLIERSSEKFAAAKGQSLLMVFGDIVETLKIDPAQLASRMPDIPEIEAAHHSKYFTHKTLSQLKKCGGALWDFAVQSVKKNLDGFDKDKWIEKLSSPKKLWTPRAAVDIGYDWSSLSLECAKEVLSMVVTNRLSNGNVPSHEVWEMLVADFENKHIGVGEWFKDVKDKIIASSTTITAQAFIFLSSWLFKYASFGENKDELRKLLPDATVRKDETCKKIMAENKAVIMQMFKKGDDATRDAFIAYVTAEVNANPNTPLTIFKEELVKK